MSDWLTGKQEAALRAVEVPTLSADFADRVMGRLEGRPDPLPIATEPRSGRARPWARRAILSSAIAAGLLSVGAAASSLMGVAIRDIPFVGTIVQAVAPAVPKPAKPKLIEPKAKPAALVAPKPAPELAAATATKEEEIASSPDLLPREVRREAFAERLAERLERRAERRREKGLPPAPLSPEERAKIKERLDQLSLEERQALQERVLEIRLKHRQERIAGGEALPPLPRLTPEERRARFEALTPEQQQDIRERIKRRRAQRMQQIQKASEPSPPLPEPPNE